MGKEGGLLESGTLSGLGKPLTASEHVSLTVVGRLGHVSNGVR